MTIIGALLGQAMGHLLGDIAGYFGFTALVGLGIYMMIESRNISGETGKFDLSKGWGLFLAALSISLDSLGIGFSILYVGVPMPVSLIVIAIVSVIATGCGLSIGGRLGAMPTAGPRCWAVAADAHRRRLHRAQGAPSRVIESDRQCVSVTNSWNSRGPAAHGRCSSSARGKTSARPSRCAPSTKPRVTRGFGGNDLDRARRRSDRCRDAQPKPRLRLSPGRSSRRRAACFRALPRAGSSSSPICRPPRARCCTRRSRTPDFTSWSGRRPPPGFAKPSRAARWADFVIVDGAIDRVAALAGGRDAVIVASGAAAAGTMSEAVDAASALVRRLSVPAFDRNEARCCISTEH